MTLDQFIIKASATYGEIRTDESSYKPMPDNCRLPDWVRRLIEQAWTEGKHEGRKLENLNQYNAKED
jgi:hypothetical protein